MAVPWTVGEAVFGVAIVAGESILALVVLGWLASGAEQDVRRALILVALSMLLGLSFLVVWFYAVRLHGAPWRLLGFVPVRRRWVLVFPWLGLALSVTFSALYAAMVSLLGLDYLVPDPVPADALGEGLYRVATIAILGVFGPLAEEVFYRAFLLAALVHPVGALRAALIASAVFAASHGNLSILVPVFVSGLILSWLYLKTRSLIPPFTAHAAQNILALSLAA